MLIATGRRSVKAVTHRPLTIVAAAAASVWLAGTIAGSAPPVTAPVTRAGGTIAGTAPPVTAPVTTAGGTLAILGAPPPPMTLLTVGTIAPPP